MTERVEYRDTEPDAFEIDGVQFWLKPLGVDTAAELGDSLAKVFTPALSAAFAAGSGAEALAQHIPAVAGSVKALDPFRDVFLKACDVQHDGRRVPLHTFRNEVFRRKHMRHYEWLAKCIELEFGDFLAEIGRRLGAALATLFGSQPEQTGESGESTPTSE